MSRGDSRRVFRRGRKEFIVVLEKICCILPSRLCVSRSMIMLRMVTTIGTPSPSPPLWNRGVTDSRCSSSMIGLTNTASGSPLSL